MQHGSPSTQVEEVDETANASSREGPDPALGTPNLRPHGATKSKRSTTPAVDAIEYRRIIGGLRYPIHTQPDLAYIVGYLSGFMESSHEEHLTAVKRILWYVAGTRGHRLNDTKKKG
jgi:hypothetical protein